MLLLLILLLMLLSLLFSVVVDIVVADDFVNIVVNVAVVVPVVFVDVDIVVDVVDIVVVVACAVISHQTRIFFPLCLCCRTSLQLLNKVANILGGSKSWTYFSLGTYLDQVADSTSSLLHRLAPHLVEEQL